MNAVVQAALSTGCTAVHPGYGFLSERPAFAELCAENGLTFVGPSPEALRALGDKLTARRLAESVDVPVSAGGTAQTAEEVQHWPNASATRCSSRQPTAAAAAA